MNLRSCRRTWGVALVLALSLTQPGISWAKSSRWSAARHPTTGASESIGDYRAGCLAGAVALPSTGPGYQLMRTARRRFFGHSELLSVVRGIASTLRRQGLGPILVGDLAQPLGGPMPRNHASHQTGLGVDIWFWHPRIAERRRLTRQERRTLPSQRVVDSRRATFTRYWSKDAAAMIWSAAENPSVSRVLVNPLIKKHLCEEQPGRTSQLRKIRPWYGHADHMHVRLLCPRGNQHCTNQEVIAPGDGCDELGWWLDSKTRRERKQGKQSYLDAVGKVPALPRECEALLERASSVSFQ